MSSASTDLIPTALTLLLVNIIYFSIAMTADATSAPFIPIRDPDTIPPFLPRHQRSLHCLTYNIQSLFEFDPIERIAFGTLTFKDPVDDPAIATKKLNSFLGWARDRFDGQIWVLHSQASRMHFHLLFLCREDIRTGTNLAGLERCRRKTLATKKEHLSAAALRLCEEFEAAADAHGFGRAELLPIWSNGDRVAAYMAKEVLRNWHNKIWPAAKGKRWWDASPRLRRAKTTARWNSPDFRRMCEDFCAALGFRDEEELRTAVGHRYAYYAKIWDTEGRKDPFGVFPLWLRMRLRLRHWLEELRQQNAASRRATAPIVHPSLEYRLS